MVNADDSASAFGGPIVCDPFTTPGGCGSGGPPPGGLLGNVYYYPQGQLVQDYIDRGQRLNVRVLMSQLDVPERAWTAGFSLPNGNVLADDLNQPLIEWFAMDLNGFIELPAGVAPGDYQFGFSSDDGAILDIDGQLILNHDGHHPTQWKCATTKVSLAAGQKYKIRVRYFQGPRYYIALRMFWRAWSQRSNPCNDTAAGKLEIVPPAALSH